MLFSQKNASIAQGINKQLERLIPITTPTAVIMGFFFPDIFINLRPFVILLFGIMTFSGALKLKAAEMGNAIKNPLPIIMFFIFSHVIMPLAAIFSSSIVFSDADIVTGFVLLFAGPTAVSGFFWILIFKGDKALGLALILLDTILAPLVVPGTLSILLGKTVTMDTSGMAISLMLMVVVPTIIGISVNEISKGKAPAVISPYLDTFSKICLFLVIAANASPVAPKIQLNNPLVWQTVIVCVLMIIFGFALIYAIVLLINCKGSKGISLIIGGGLRNNSATMTLAVNFFPEHVALPIIMSLITQQTIAAFAGKLITRKFFNKKIAESEQTDPK